MKKTIMLTLAIMLFVCGNVLAADWSEYESQRNNVRVAGYSGQPGYIAFENGSGTVLGYMWMSAGSGATSGLVWCSAGSTSQTPTASKIAGGAFIGTINLENTKLTDSYGVAISNGYTGTITGKAY